MCAKRIAVIMTCHNRKDITLSCLASLVDQELNKDLNLQYYIVDDGSTDGTMAAIKENYPFVNMYQGDGNLYWCGGMRLGFAKAMEGDYSHYLWMNDDSLLYRDALTTMMNISVLLKEEEGRDVIIAGSLRDPFSRKLAYGGKKYYPWRRKPFRLIEPSLNAQKCDVLNGNCVIIPRDIVKAIGNLSPFFVQSAGDYDYCLRARAHGYSSWIAPGFVGTCSKNKLKETWGKFIPTSIGKADMCMEPLALLRMRDSLLFSRLHCKYFWPIRWLRGFLHMGLVLEMGLGRYKQIYKNNSVLKADTVV